MDTNNWFLLLLVPLVSTQRVDYRQVYSDIERVLWDNSFDDGSYGPIFVRLAWHTSGTFNQADGSGGSNGATMRFLPESAHQDNKGLDIARRRLEPIKRRHPNLSYGDLWTLSSVVAIYEMGGPSIPWAPGRLDAPNGGSCPPDQRLPSALKAPGAPSVREIRSKFSRMGFNDSEAVALIGAHVLGRLHRERSQFEGVWTNRPTRFSNDFFRELQRPHSPDRNSDPLVFRAGGRGGGGRGGGGRGGRGGRGRGGRRGKRQAGGRGRGPGGRGGRGPPGRGGRGPGGRGGRGPPGGGRGGGRRGRRIMLTTDIALQQDQSYASHVRRFNNNERAFFGEFAAAFSKLIHLGTPAQPGRDWMRIFM